MFGRGVADQAEAEPAGEKVVPAPLHGTACLQGAYSRSARVKMSFVSGSLPERKNGEWKRSAFGAPHSDGNLRRKENWRFLIETRRQRTVRISLYPEHGKAFMGGGGPYGHQKRWWRVPGIAQLLPSQWRAGSKKKK
jgi:hypothetical protein